MARREVFTTEEYTYAVILKPDEEAGGYVVTCPALPGMVAEGDTLEEARAKAARAIRNHLERRRKDGLPLPPSEIHPRAPIRDRVSVLLQRL